MCGISGILHFHNERQASQDRLKKMTDALEHRGPDGEGHFVKNNLALGHRRLSILDLEGGYQPMVSEDESLVISFNGEIYNYIELRDELVKLGCKFHTQSDTEVILKAYETWGTDCQLRLNGMWAFAIWDARKQQLFVSRDRVGEKPLHYALHDDTFFFGSEIKALKAAGVPMDISLEMMEVYLVFTYIPEPHTFYKSIQKLEAGHCLIVCDGKVRKQKYWDLPELDESNMIQDEARVLKTFEELFSDSVRIRMRSDVSFGAFLSGGLDSASIVALMSGYSDLPVNTFTIGFDDAQFDESALAEQVAKKFGTNHHRGTVHPEEFDQILGVATNHFDEPFGDSSAIPTWQVSGFARQKVKMALTGDGGDEVLSGYQSFLGLSLTQRLNKMPSPLVKAASSAALLTAKALRGAPRYKMNKVQSVLSTSLQPFHQRMLSKQSYASIDLIKAMTSAQKDIVPVEEYFSDLTAKFPVKDDFYKMVYLNFKHNLPNDYLVKVDRMSMAQSLETRAPFLDHRLIEFMVHVDKKIKLKGWETKSVLRSTIGRQLPNDLLHAPKKGFGMPLRNWFREDGLQNHLADLKGLRSILSDAAVNEIISANQQGKNDHGNFIWVLMMLNQFTEH